MLVGGLTGHPSDRTAAVTGGVTLLVLALLPLLAARGLVRLRGWSRGPAVITQVMALPVAYNMVGADGVAVPAGIVLGVVAFAALYMLINPETTLALGIRGPGNAGKRS
ncbi:Integral membrane protein OS=Streptomyces tendae OX=1932 GN=GUR47_14625 PE=4 SV=1 [Streptomyces tendae]